MNRTTADSRIRLRSAAPVAIAAALCWALTAAAQNCTPRWLHGPDQGVPGVDGVFRHAIAHNDGSGPAVYIGGGRLRGGTLLEGNPVRVRGETWEHVGGGVDGLIDSMAEYRGELFVGGQFESAGGLPIRNLARWDGARWQGTGLALEPHHEVFSLGVCLGELVACIGVQSPPRPPFAMLRWDGQTWRPMGDDPQLTGRFFTEVYGRVYAITNSPARPEEVSLWTGASWEPFGDLFDPTDLAEHGGDLVVSGHFRIVNGRVLNGVARWDGDEWQPFGEGIPHEQVGDLLSHNGHLYVQAFVSGQDSAVFRWTGSAWERLGGLFAGYPWLVGEGDSIAAAGDISYRGASAALGMARWDGAEWRALGRGFDEAVEDLWNYGDKVIFNGRFRRAGPLESPPLALWDGAGWTSIPRPGPDVNDTAEYGGDLIAAGGEFVFPGRRDHVARWDGSRWGPLGGGPAGTVYTLHVHNGLLFAGGSFHEAGGFTADNIAVWDGAAWSGVGAGLTGEVYALASWQGRLVASAGRPNQMWAWDGQAWHAMPGIGRDAVRVLAVHQDSLFAAHTQYVNPARRFTGTVWESIGISYGFVQGLTTWQGRLYACGRDLVAAGAEPRSGPLLRWEGGPAWSYVEGLESSIGVGVETMVAFGDQLVVAGRIDSAGPQGSFQWARLGCEPCYADCDDSTGPRVLDIFDFLCFQNRYAAGAPYACDCDTGSGPGVCDVFDFLCFQNAFAAGCP